MSGRGWFDVEENVPQSTGPTTPPSSSKWYDVEEVQYDRVQDEQKRAEIDQLNVLPQGSKRSRRPAEGSSMGTKPAINLTRAYEPPYPSSLNPEVMDPLVAFWARMVQPMDAYNFKAYNAKSQVDPNTLNWDQAMAAPDREQFLEAADLEIKQLVDHQTWEEVPKSSATGKIIPNQWVFVQKYTSSGEFRKNKARCVLRGDLQNFDSAETYAPVASWSTVRMFLLISAVLERVTATIDFSNAFVQSPMPEDKPVWTHIPRGYRCTKGPGYCLRLKKSTYGDARAPRMWFDFISKHFKELGLKQSVIDPCLWYGRGLMLVQYVDDIGISARTKAEIDKFVKELRDRDLTLTQEETFSEFLGIKFEKKNDGSIEMTQRGLIKKVLESAGMSDCNPNATPATQQALGADEDGEPMQETWNYRAIVGMLLYLSTNTRPDIAYAVSQVARFSAKPKKSHASAIKTILRYLKKTMNMGTIVKPTKHLQLHLYVDADFAGLFKREDDRNPDSVRSRTGYVILLSGWPIIWKSKLQTHLSQSTLEAEYSALSYSLKALLPLKELSKEMVKELKHEVLEDPTIRCTVFEDNMGAYYLATNQRITNRTKYFLVKWHWFWEKYNEGHFKIVKCPTDEQQADFLTKSLARDKFEANRLAVLGW